MKIAIFGAGGNIGQSITREALTRGHQVTAVVRDATRLPLQHERLAVKVGDVLEAASVAEAVAGHDVVISGVGPRPSDTDGAYLVKAAQALLAGLKQSKVQRLVVVGGAGSLEVAPGLQLIDAPSFPAAWRGIAQAHLESLAVYQTADLDWTYFSPAALIEPGARTGQFRLGGTHLLTDAQGNSRISIDDYAIALIDEVEQGQYKRLQMTIAY